jgi:hypothetical protein
MGEGRTLPSAADQGFRHGQRPVRGALIINFGRDKQKRHETPRIVFPLALGGLAIVYKPRKRLQSDVNSVSDAPGAYLGRRHCKHCKCLRNQDRDAAVIALALVMRIRVQQEVSRLA